MSPWFSVSVIGVDTEAASVVLALLGIAHSVVGFLKHGGRRISAPGVFLLGMALFGFFPTIYYVSVLGAQPHALEVPGLTLLLTSQVFLYAIWRQWSNAEGVLSPVTASRSVTAMGAGCGAVLLGFAVLAQWQGVAALGSLTRAIGYAGVVLLAVSLVRSSRRISVRELLALAALFLIFFLLIFEGGGRLVLGSLAIALALAVGARSRPAFLKPLAVAVLPPAVYVLAQFRAESRRNFATGYEESGIESVVWPQRMFLDVLDGVTSGSLPLAGGQTFLNSLVVWVPREVWAEKPVGLGTELTAIYKPHLLSQGHSEAAMLQGEFVYNFSAVGILLMVVVCGWAVLKLDRMLLSLQASRADTPVHLVAHAAVVVLVACLLDLVWVGSWTYLERAGFAVAVLAVLYVALLVLAPKNTQVDRSLPPADMAGA